MKTDLKFSFEILTMRRFLYCCLKKGSLQEALGIWMSLVFLQFSSVLRFVTMVFIFYITIQVWLLMEIQKASVEA